MNDVEVRVVKNGYMVRPSTHDRSMVTVMEEIRVFETFEGLTEFLKSNLVKPKESKQS